MSFGKPHEKVSAKAMNRWIILILTKAGIDTKVFSANSIRHASTSAALKRGEDLDTVKKISSWSSKSLMSAKFHKRTIVSYNKSFAVTVLMKK